MVRLQERIPTFIFALTLFAGEFGQHGAAVLAMCLIGIWSLLTFELSTQRKAFWRIESIAPFVLLLVIASDTLACPAWSIYPGYAYELGFCVLLMWPMPIRAPQSLIVGVSGLLFIGVHATLQMWNIHDILAAGFTRLSDFRAHINSSSHGAGMGVSAAPICIATYFSSLAFARRAHSTPAKWLQRIVLSLYLCCVILSFSRSWYWSLLISVFATSLLSLFSHAGRSFWSEQRHKLMFGAVSLTVAAFSSAAFYSGRLVAQSFLEVLVNRSGISGYDSVHGRLRLMTLAIRAGAAKAPLFGVGLRRAGEYLNVDRAPGTLPANQSFSLFSQMFLEHGTIGLMSILIIFGALLLRSHKNRTMPRVQQLLLQLTCFQVFLLNCFSATALANWANVILTALLFAEFNDATNDSNKLQTDSYTFYWASNQERMEVS